MTSKLWAYPAKIATPRDRDAFVMWNAGYRYGGGMLLTRKLAECRRFL